jgi:protein TonB
MPRHAALIAAVLTAIALNAAAQTDPPTPAADTSQPPSSPGPKTNTCSRPVYPREALRKEWTGVSTVAFLIGPDGLVKNTRILKSSGHDILDEAAREALSLCQFKPATADGKPVASWQPVQYVWTIEPKRPAPPPSQ